MYCHGSIDVALCHLLMLSDSSHARQNVTHLRPSTKIGLRLGLLDDEILTIVSRFAHIIQ